MRHSRSAAAGIAGTTVGFTLAAALSAVGCAEKEAVVDSRTFVQASAPGPAQKTVTINEEGRYQPGCVDIQAGQTVEWRNRNTSLATNVTSLGEPAELFSPNLVAPYNLCQGGQPTADCADLGADYVFWRHRFAAAGLFEYLDTNTAEGGRVVRDEYYGTVTVVGLPESASTGAVCVAGSRSDGGEQRCDEVCCATRLTCPEGYDCIEQRCRRP